MSLGCWDTDCFAAELDQLHDCSHVNFFNYIAISLCLKHQIATAPKL